MQNRDNIGKQIQTLRTKKDLTQEELAGQLNVSKQTISNWETGTKTPRMGAIQKLADFFNVPKSYIVDGEERSSDSLTMYNFKDDEKELLRRYRTLSQNSKDTVLRFVIDLELRGTEQTQENIDYLSLAKELSSSNIISIRELAIYTARNLENNGKVRESIKNLLFNCKVFVDDNKTNTAEFINVKRKIYETLLPLSMFSVAYENGISTIQNFAKHFKLSEGFLTEALNYYAAIKGTTFEYNSSLNDFVIDISNIPLEYVDEKSGNAEILIQVKEKN
ncbi:helix-turn-helix domain-containing protein [Enterococcus larvae]|nr:helix-turn-helix transcriptional regulator [Enterococcus larvae]